MPKLDTVLVVHTTAWDDGANTNAKFELEIAKTGPNFKEKFPDLPPDEREMGRTDVYQFNVSGKISTEDGEFRIIMRMLDSQDTWLPSSIFVLGQTTTGELILLGDHPQWSEWFQGIDQHDISGGATVEGLLD